MQNITCPHCQGKLEVEYKFIYAHDLELNALPKIILDDGREVLPILNRIPLRVQIAFKKKL